MKKFVSITAIILLIAIFCGVLTACNKEYTMEEKLEARAIQLGKKVIEYYLDSEIYSAANDWEIILYEEYLPTQKETNGIASVWHHFRLCNDKPLDDAWKREKSKVFCRTQCQFVEGNGLVQRNGEHHQLSKRFGSTHNVCGKSCL